MCNKFYGALAFALLLVSSAWFVPASAGTTWSTFAEIPFGTSIADTRSMMAAKGYTFSKRTDNGNDQFMGNVFNQKTDILAYYDDKKQLAKFVVNLETEDDDARRVYDALHTQLLAKYGTPKADFHFFSTPYREGDGYTVQAIRLGKGTFGTYWPQPDGTDMVSLEITKQLTVQVGYEGPTWDAFIDRKTANQIKDL